MKKTLLIVILLLSYTVFSQKKFTLDRDSFIIGMFDNYNGRQIALDHPKQSTILTGFYCSQKKLKQIFIDSILKFYNPKDLRFEKTLIYSKSLSNYFNNYYNFKKAKNMGFIYDEKDYAAYFSFLKKRKFSSHNKKLSFLLGTFYRYGKIENNELQIKLANSASQCNAIIYLLKKLNFKFSKEMNCEYCAPRTTTIKFTPKEEYFKLFLNINPPESNIDDCE